MAPSKSARFSTSQSANGITFVPPILKQKVCIASAGNQAHTCCRLQKVAGDYGTEAGLLCIRPAYMQNWGQLFHVE
jgi:hypothetical protein